MAKWETDQLVQQNDIFLFFQSSPLMIFVYIVGIIFLLNWAEKLANVFIWHYKEYFREKFADSLFLKMYRRLSHVQLWIYSNKRNQDLFDKILWEKYFVGLILQTVTNYINMIIFIVWSVGILYQVDKKIWIALLIGGVCYYWFYYLEKKIDVYSRFETWELERALREIERITRSEFHKLIYAWWSKLIQDTVEEYNTTRRESVQKNNRKRELVSAAKGIVSSLIENGIKISVAMSIFAGISSLGSLALTIALLNRLSWFMSSIIDSKREMDDAIQSLDILELYLEATEQQHMEQDISQIHYDHITFNHLTFAYPQFTEYELKYFDILLKKIDQSTTKSDEKLNQLHAIQEAKEKAKEISPMILHDTHLTFNKGKIYGIVGRNWAGKTTMMHLLMNYFTLPPQSIMRGRHGNEDLWLDFFEQNIAVIEQDPFILRWFTIKQNLLLGVSKEYSDEQLYEILSMFDLDTKIRSMRKWLDTVYSYDCDLSWGQLQIISLLRVYLQDKPVMILDEWTNQLDATNEAKVMNLLLKNRDHKIIIMISHRMTSLQKADELLCLENGIITDRWTPKELKQRPSLYQQFRQEQVESI